MPGPEITIRDVYDQQLRAADQLSQLREEVAGHTSRVNERLEHGSQRMRELAARIDAHDGRFTALESDRDRRLGKADAITIILSLAGSGIVTTVAGYLLTHH